MIQLEQQLKLQAYLDGELSGSEARQVADWVAQDPAAAALLNELRQTNQTLVGLEDGVKVPETREFYWSKIKTAIEHEERQARRAVVEVSWISRLRRVLVPAAGLALVALVAVVGVRNLGQSRYPSTVTFLEDVQAFTYHDFSAGTTLVWLSYPADKRIAGEDELAIIE